MSIADETRQKGLLNTLPCRPMLSIHGLRLFVFVSSVVSELVGEQATVVSYQLPFLRTAVESQAQNCEPS